MILLDDMQLDEPDSSSSRYQSISGVKADLQSALDLVGGRLGPLTWSKELIRARWVGPLHRCLRRSTGPWRNQTATKPGPKPKKLSTRRDARNDPCPFVMSPVRRAKNLTITNPEVGFQFCLLFLFSSFLRWSSFSPVHSASFIFVLLRAHTDWYIGVFIYKMERKFQFLG